MQVSQESLKTFFDKRFQTLKTDITKEFGTKTDSLKDSFDLEIRAITTRAESLETKVSEALNAETINRSVDGLGRILDQNLVVRNLTMPRDETNEKLVVGLSKMFQQIGVYVNILEAVRITPARASATAGGSVRQATPLVKVVLSSEAYGRRKTPNEHRLKVDSHRRQTSQLKNLCLHLLFNNKTDSKWKR